MKIKRMIILTVMTGSLGAMQPSPQYCNGLLNTVINAQQQVGRNSQEIQKYCYGPQAATTKVLCQNARNATEVLEGQYDTYNDLYNKQCGGGKGTGSFK